jgi:hypothetical protein
MRTNARRTTARNLRCCCSTAPAMHLLLPDADAFEVADMFSLPALAQAPTMEQFVEAFGGTWQIVDDRYATPPAACQVALGATSATSGRYAVQLGGCRGELALVDSWGISNDQMALFDVSGQVIARLGGNQARVSGTSAAGSPMILEKVGVPGPAAMLEAARRASGCFYAGFTSRCAADAELAKPAGEAPRVQVLVNLNIRSEARDDASIIGVVPAASCVTTELCMTATDGVWCRANFGERAGWLRKLALRQNRWPVVTFENSCTSANGQAEPAG